MSYLGVGQARSDLIILIQHHIEPLAHLVREQELLRLLPQPLGLGQQLTNEKRVLRALANEGQVLPDRPAPGSSAFPPVSLGKLSSPVPKTLSLKPLGPTSTQSNPVQKPN